MGRGKVATGSLNLTFSTKPTGSGSIAKKGHDAGDKFPHTTSSGVAEAYRTPDG
jgi:hypothetical protein